MMSLMKYLIAMVCIAHNIVEGNDYQHFYGASLSHSVNQTDDQNLHEVHMLLISGWVLGKGPCGQSCSEVDVGHDTDQTRQMMTTNYGETYFGQWFEEYKISHSRTTLNITRAIVSNMIEKVFGVNFATQWEQEIMTTKFLLNSSNIPKKIDIKYEGDSWRNRTSQSNRTSANDEKWNLQFNINLGVRSDTGTPNQSPVVFAKPYYRLQLDDINEIHIAAFDRDGDFVKCKQLTYGSALSLSANPLKGLTVMDSCTIKLNTSSALGYKDDFWGGIAVGVRDYNKYVMYMGGYRQLPGVFSIGGSPVQFLVQVLKATNFPKFVIPTPESNHEFTIYIGASWTVVIYAEAVENKVIRQFYSYGMQNEKILQSNITDDDHLNRDKVKKIQISWTPDTVDVGGHIICTRAIDNTGVDSSKDKCFILKVIDRAFSASSTRRNQSIPYFINLPTDALAVVCEEERTCALPIYVNSSNKIKEVRITSSDLDMSKIGKEITNIGVIYKTDLFMRHSVYGQQTICLVATDSIGFSSNETCIFVEIEAPHPCYSKPCVNSGECRRHVNDTSDYQCVNCPPGFSGRNCEIRDLGFCDTNPCNGQLCLTRTNTCYCKKGSGFTGPTCSINIDDCKGVNCSNHGVCKDRIDDFTCECFKRYNGTNCETDRCPDAPAHALSCPGDSVGCARNQCTHGICIGNNTCLCNLGYSGDANCTQALGNLGNTYSNVTILPPTLKARSTITCYTAEKCTVKLYFTVSDSANVQISVIKVTEELKYNTSTSSSLDWNEIDGLDGMMTGDVSVISNKERQGYICAQVDDGASQDSRCFALNFISNPMNVTSSAEYIQKDRAIKFISPTPNSESTIVCRRNESCYIMLYTSLNATGLCDLPISTDEGVAVLEVRNVTNGCLSQVAMLLQTQGNHHVCFQSTIMSSEAQTRCFRIQVYDTDPCPDGKCQNNAICLYNGDASDNTTCACETGYGGVHCERGPCQAADNNCLHGYCDVNDHNTTCICPIGIKGDRCQTSIPNAIVDPTDNGAQFTDIALPSLINCVRNRLCSVPLIASGIEIPNIRPGYTSSYIDIADIGIQSLENGSYLVNLNLIGHRVGLWDTCVLSMNNMSVNKDELCFKVNVEKGTSSVYSEKDKPHFTDPSVPPNSDLVCKVNESCHLFMNATPGGQFVSSECVELSVTVTPEDVTKYNIFSKCERCMNGSSNIKYCQFDVAMYLTVDVDLCLQARTTISKVLGEKRCYHLSSIPEIAKKGCQVLHCKNGGFCDGHVEPAKCHCPAMYTGTVCETDLSSDLSSLENSVLTGVGGVPNEVVCQLGKACEIVHSALDPSVTLTTGYIAPGLKTNLSSITSEQSTLTVYSSSPGKKVLCLQALQGSLVKDEQCMTVNFVVNGGSSVDKGKPYFIAPTPPRKSVILCNTNSSCHLDIHFPKGNLFRSALTCPALSETSTTPVDGVYIFPSTENPTDCSSDVSYITPYVNKDTQQDLCLQVSLPGKRGEERCFVMLIVPNITNTVTRPCAGMTCENSAVCVADLSVQPSTGNCICQSGYIGDDCSQDNQSVTHLPGYFDTNSSKNSTQSDKTPHFDQTSGIPSNVMCIKNRPCTVQITYRGDANKPPLPGYISSPLSVSNITVASTPANGTHIALYTLTNIHAGVHRSCIQTTLNGSRDGLNLDEICFNITVSAGSTTTPPSSAGSNFGNSSYSNGSTLSCQTDSVCHLSFFMKGSPNCTELRECGVGVPSLHVFDIQHGTSCLADVAIKTGHSSTFQDICLSSGGEERHIQVEIRTRTEYGPCQSLHCANGGFCNASNNIPVCECKSRFSGSECEIVPDTTTVTYNTTSTSAVPLIPSVTNNVPSTSAVSLTPSLTHNAPSISAVPLIPSVTNNVPSTSADPLTPSVTNNVASTSAVSDTTSATYNTTSTSAVPSIPSVTNSVTSTSAVSDTTSATYNTMSTSAVSDTISVTDIKTMTSDVCTGEAARGAAQRAKEVVKSGKVSCYCIVRGPDNVERRVQIIKGRPKMTVAQILKHAGYGAGAMTGVLLICLVSYHVVVRMKKPRSQDRVQRIHKTPQWYME